MVRPAINYKLKLNNMAVKTPIQYKGFIINYIRKEYRANAYAEPEFSNTNLAKLKKEINQHLKS